LKIYPKVEDSEVRQGFRYKILQVDLNRKYDNYLLEVEFTK